MPEEQIDALLLHEACHALTLPNTLISVPVIREEMIPFLADCTTSYHEYLAHVEFVSRFRQNTIYKHLREYYISLFTNFETIISSLKTMMSIGRTRGLQMNQFAVLQQIQCIAYDALFFYVVEDDSFLRWCQERGLEGLYSFINWFFEDFEHIRKLDLSPKQASDKAIISGTLSMSVNPIKLMIQGQIEFADTTKKLHEEMIERGQDIDLVELWKKRVEFWDRFYFH